MNKEINVPVIRPKAPPNPDRPYEVPPEKINTAIQENATVQKKFKRSVYPMLCFLMPERCDSKEADIEPAAIPVSTITP